jgi:hypothetical protein
MTCLSLTRRPAGQILQGTQIKHALTVQAGWYFIRPGLGILNRWMGTIESADHKRALCLALRS